MYVPRSLESALASWSRTSGSAGTLAASAVWRDPACRGRLPLIIVVQAAAFCVCAVVTAVVAVSAVTVALVLAEAARSGLLSGWSGEGRARELVVDEVAGDFGDLTVVVAGVGPQ
jgi:hypothetical protein